VASPASGERCHLAGLCRGQHGRQPLRRRASEPALDSRAVAAGPHLAFAGLQAYHGSAQHLQGWDGRRHAIAPAADRPDAPVTC
jgi:hypothetical protein